jgi:hypothetical protein
LPSSSPSGGLTNIAQIQATGSSLVVANVPSGTYYVRMRGLNDVGAGAASNEVVVTVQ